MSGSIVPKAVAAAAFFAALTVTADAGVDVHIDKTTQRMFVAVDGVTQYVWNVSTGAAGYDTPSGNFRPFRMERDHFSREWDSAPMPHSIFFTTEGHAIHGSQHTASLGRPASHGCVRLAPEHAARLFELVSLNGLEEASISVSGGYASPAAAPDGDVADGYPSAPPPLGGDVATGYRPPPLGGQVTPGYAPVPAPPAGEVVPARNLY